MLLVQLMTVRGRFCSFEGGVDKLVVYDRVRDGVWNAMSTLLKFSTSRGREPFLPMSRSSYVSCSPILSFTYSCYLALISVLLLDANQVDGS